MRTVHSLLWYKRFISELQEDTLILCGDMKACLLLTPMCVEKYKKNGVDFWLPYPSPFAGIVGDKFSNFVVDSSWDKDNLTQAQIDWFERVVVPLISDDVKIFHAP